MPAMWMPYNYHPVYYYAPLLSSCDKVSFSNKIWDNVGGIMYYSKAPSVLFVRKFFLHEHWHSLVHLWKEFLA